MQQVGPDAHYVRISPSNGTQAVVENRSEALIGHKVALMRIPHGRVRCNDPCKEVPDGDEVNALSRPRVRSRR